MNHKEIFYTQTDDYTITIFKTKEKTEYQFLIETWAKDNNTTMPGIRYSLQWVKTIESPIEQQIAASLSRTLKDGQLSPRPYQPGQACDGTISSCTIGLFHDLCKKRHLNPLKIYRKAYPEESNTQCKRTLNYMHEFSAWQGIAIPLEWHGENTTLLMQSLHNANFHQLANELREELGIE